MPLEVGSSQFDFHLVSCGFLGFWNGDVWWRRWFNVIRLVRRALPLQWCVFPGAHFSLWPRVLCLFLLLALRMAHAFSCHCFWAAVWEETGCLLR